MRSNQLNNENGVTYRHGAWPTWDMQWSYVVEYIYLVLDLPSHRYIEEDLEMLS
jgi:hypothetical protein